jgi:hypothetical protein
MRAAVIMDRDSLIFLPSGGAGEFSHIAESMRSAEGPVSGSGILAIQSSYLEWVNVQATHLGLHAMDSRGQFQPIVLIPLLPFIRQPSEAVSFRRHPLFRLSWHGHPNESRPMNM